MDFYLDDGGIPILKEFNDGSLTTSSESEFQSEIVRGKKE